MPKFKTTIEIEVEVQYSWDEGQKETWGYDGGDPPIPAHAEDLEIIYPKELDETTMEQLREEVEEHFSELKEE